MDYKSSGVDIEAGRSFVERLKDKAPKIGGFNGMMRVPAGYEKPVLVSGADGVGTKINIASIASDYTTIGQDLVAMCVNDVITCGAKPLYFLDYISLPKITYKLDQVMEGIIKGCEIAEMDLLGGETAEHGRFSKEYDLAGFCTGIVEENEIIDGSLIKEGDKIIGIESSGLHSNGYSLINDMLWRHKIFWKDTPELLTPTTIYASLIQDLLDEFPILGMAHITGGGIPENLPRCIPEGLKPQVDYNSWPFPDVFSKIMLAGEILEDEMKKVFNLGIGFCLVVPPEVEPDIHLRIYGNGYKSWTIGQVVV
jgi:phosphoribosylformylglycinamidine cyclo-ligase